jgi:hypothetical protein
MGKDMSEAWLMFGFMMDPSVEHNLTGHCDSGIINGIEYDEETDGFKIRSFWLDNMFYYFLICSKDEGIHAKKISDDGNNFAIESIKRLQKQYTKIREAELLMFCSKFGIEYKKPNFSILHEHGYLS